MAGAVSGFWKITILFFIFLLFFCPLRQPLVSSRKLQFTFRISKFDFGLFFVQMCDTLEPAFYPSFFAPPFFVFPCWLNSTSSFWGKVTFSMSRYEWYVLFIQKVMTFRMTNHFMQYLSTLVKKKESCYFLWWKCWNLKNLPTYHHSILLSENWSLH